MRAATTHLFSDWDFLWATEVLHRNLRKVGGTKGGENKIGQGRKKRDS